MSDRWQIVPDIGIFKSKSSRITSSEYLSDPSIPISTHPSTCLLIYLSISSFFSELLFAFSLPSHAPSSARRVRTMIYGFKVSSRSRSSTTKRGPPLSLSLSSSEKNSSAGSSWLLRDVETRLDDRCFCCPSHVKSKYWTWQRLVHLPQLLQDRPAFSHLFCHLQLAASWAFLWAYKAGNIPYQRFHRNVREYSGWKTWLTFSASCGFNEKWTRWIDRLLC